MDQPTRRPRGAVRTARDRLDLRSRRAKHLLDAQSRGAIAQRAALYAALSLDLGPRVRVGAKRVVPDRELVEEDSALERIDSLVEQLRHRTASGISELRKSVSRPLAHPYRGAHRLSIHNGRLIRLQDHKGAALDPRRPDARLGALFVVRATKKLLDRCGGVSSSEQPGTTVLGDWYATALFWKPQVALFVNEPTRLPGFVSLASTATLAPRFVSRLRSVFDVYSLGPRFIDSELAEMTQHRLAKTLNRGVVGT